jgi:hypothetical protein
MADISEFSIITYERNRGIGARPLPEKAALELSTVAIRCAVS